MRFVPHATESFQYSLDEISDDYDSDYSSDDSLETMKVKEESKDWLNSSELAVTNVDDILDDFHVNERYQLVSESAALLSQNSSGLESTMNKFIDSLIHSYEESPITSDENELVNKFKTMLSVDTRDVEESTRRSFATIDKEVEDVIRQVEEERRRKEEEERRRLEEEARIRAQQEKERRERLLELLRKKLELELELARKLKEAEEALKEKLRKALELAKLQKEAELLKEEEERKQLAQSQLGLHNETKIQKEFLKYKQDIADIKLNVVEPLLANKELKQLTNKIRRKINPKFGQLTNSKSKLMTIFDEISALVNESRTLNELSYKYILNFIAKELIKQAELEVTVSPQHGVPLGLLSCLLLQKIPELSYYLLARFYKKCPYLIGYTCAIDTEEGRIRMGWRRSNNKWEEETKYNERVGGIATLYSVMTRFDISNDPVSMSQNWLFVSRMLNINTELLQDVHYIIMANWWDACCKEFLATYGRQAVKLVQLVSSDWLQLSEGKKFSGYVRLRLLAEDWISGKTPTSFKEMEL